MATSAERMRALRERERRGLRRLTIDVSETDLQAIAERGSEGAASTDHDQQAQAVGSFSHRVTVTAPLRVTCHVTTSLWRCAVTVTRHLLRLEKFDNRHSTHGLVAKLIEQA